MEDENVRRGLETMAAESAEYFRKAQEAQERIATVVGAAESDDGRVRVTWQGDRLDDLEIHPQAMRMGSADLARTVMCLAEEARADCRRQAQEIMSSVFGTEDPARLMNDRAALQHSLDAMRRSFTDAVDQSADLIKRLQGGRVTR